MCVQGLRDSHIRMDRDDNYDVVLPPFGIMQIILMIRIYDKTFT